MSEYCQLTRFTLTNLNKLHEKYQSVGGKKSMTDYDKGRYELLIELRHKFHLDRKECE